MTTKTTAGVIENNYKNDLSDNELALLVRQSHPELFSLIVDRYQKKLYAYFFRFERNREEVEDLVQDVFLKVYQNLHNYDDRREFSCWIWSIARNSAINHVKHESLKKFISLESITESESESKVEFPSLEEDPSQLYIRKETNEKVDEAIEQLPENYKQVLILRYHYDKSYEEIGKIIGKSMNTVGTLIRRAKNKMLAQLEKANGQMAALEVKCL